MQTTRRDERATRSEARRTERNRRTGPSRHAAFAAGLLSLLLAGPAIAETRQVAIPVPPLVTSPIGGRTHLAIDGFALAGDQGEPRLPTRTYRIVLPQDTDRASVVVTASIQRSHREPLAAPLETGPAVTTAIAPGTLVAHPRPAAGAGARSAAAPIAGFAPAAPLGAVRVVRRRGWVVLRVEILPVSVNAAGDELRVSEAVEVTVTFDRTAQAMPAATGVATIQSQVLRQGIQTWPSVSRGYAIAPVGTAGSRGHYLLITTDLISREAALNGLDAFVAHKEALGFTVDVDTVEAIDRRRPNGDLQRKIRLRIRKAVDEQGTGYVLLVGNPDPLSTAPGAIFPEEAAVPMRKCSGDGASYTDMYYACPRGSWNRDGDDQYGEVWSEITEPEVAVGRIAPVGGYVAGVWESASSKLLSISRKEKLRAVFEKMIRYDLELDRAWRYQLLPIGSYMYGKDKGNTALTLSTTVDAVRAASANFQDYAIYQDGTPWLGYDLWFDGLPDPEANGALAGDKSLRAGESTPFYAWANGAYGAVFWRAHGGAFNVSVGGGSGTLNTKDGAFLDRTWLLAPARYQGISLTDDHPSIVISASCNNMNIGTGPYGKGDFAKQLSKWASLAQTLQYQGAICVIAATYETAGEASAPADPTLGQSAWYQRRFLVEVASGATFGDAFLRAKAEVRGHYATNTGANWKLRDWFRINLLADPAQRLFEPFSGIPDDRFDVAQPNNSRANATLLYAGSRPRTGAWTTHQAVRGAVAKDADWYALTGLGRGKKAVTVVVTRNARLGEVALQVVDKRGRTIAGQLSATDDELRFETTGRTAAGAVYVQVAPTTHIARYDLSVDIAR